MKNEEHCVRFEKHGVSSPHAIKIKHGSRCFHYSAGELSGQCQVPQGFFTTPRTVQRQNGPALLQRVIPTIQRPKCIQLAVKSGARQALRGTAPKED